MPKLFKYFLVVFVAATIATPVFMFTPVGAADPAGSGNPLVDDAKCVETEQAKCVQCVATDYINEDCTIKTDNGTCTAQTCDIMAKYVNPFITALTGIAGIAAVIGIMIGGIQYASSGGDPQKSSSAKGHIRKAIIALVAFFFTYAFLQFLIPGKGLLGV